MSNITQEDIEASRKEDLLWFLDLRAQHLSEEAKELLVEKLYHMIYSENETETFPESLPEIS